MRWIKSRNNQVILAILVLMAALGIRLFVLTMIDGETWSSYATDLSNRSIYTVAPRGEILDRYGRLLAGNEPTFAVQFDATGLENPEINGQAERLIALFEKNGDAYVDNFPIMIDGNGRFYYTYQQTVEEWLSSESMPVTFTAEEAFNELRTRNGIDGSLDKYEAQAELQTKFGIFPPISVKKMQFSAEQDRESFLGRFGMKYSDLKAFLTAEEMEELEKNGTKSAYNLNFDDLKAHLSADRVFQILRAKYEINPELSDYQARKILVVRNEIAALGYSSYIPAKIAKDVSETTIVNVEERSSDFKGVTVAAESLRVYPNGSTASHVLGYLGQISDSQKDDYLDKGYRPSDMIGKSGVEASFEDVLRGTDGVETVEVNALGERTKVISETPAAKGSDVYLTIDLELQKTAEDALERVLKAIQVGGTFQSKWGNYPYSSKYASPNANSGAVVALDVKTGEVLAMASFPDYDPNLFATGISTEAWKALQPDNPRDQLAPRPLLNIALNTPIQPGSTFKPVTATAALESGLDPNRRLKDGGYIMVGNRPYNCLIWTNSHRTHGSVNLYEAIEVSCNYYFYDLATNKDNNSNRSLGLSSDMGIEKISQYAKEYGLGIKTGIELGETVTEAPTAQLKMRNTETQLRRELLSKSELYFKEEVVADKATLNKYIAEIASWCEEDPVLSRNETIKRMADVGVKEDMIETVADKCKYTYFNQAKWTVGDELNISIGQGENAYTPIQMANYMATLANKGLRNQVNVVKAIEGTGAIKKAAAVKMDVTDDSIFDELLDGMNRVAQSRKGSAFKVFNNFPVDVAAKTGTAEKGGSVPPVDEVEYIKNNLSRIAPGLKWEDVEIKMNSLMEDDPDNFPNKNVAVDSAVIRLSNYKVTAEKINAYKGTYKPFSWFICTAPVEDPQIAVAVLLVQGNQGGFGAPVAREIIGQYLGLDETYEDYSLDTTIVQ